MEEFKEFVADNELLDLLFSFIGASSHKSQEEMLLMQHSDLNLFTRQKENKSRQTAGTTDQMPGQNPDFDGENLNVASDPSSNPELLPVSCGYFFNIVRQLLMKQRKQILRYLLITTGGRIFDRLVQNIKYHSLSDLLLELMQVNVAYIQMSTNNSTSVSKNSDGEGSPKSDSESKLSEDQNMMKKVLDAKKVMVVKQLILQMNHRNT